MKFANCAQLSQTATFGPPNRLCLGAMGAVATLNLSGRRTDGRTDDAWCDVSNDDETLFKRQQVALAASFGQLGA